MFCCLYELYQATGLKVFEHELDCVHNCKDYKNDKCIISKDLEIKLTKDRYSWIVNKIINIKELTPNKNSSLFYDKMIRLIHPVHTDVWLFRCFDKDKKDVFYFVYYGGNKQKNLLNETELNEYLKSNFEYNGRKITDKDFNI